jgi:hypothetical protein
MKPLRFYVRYQNTARLAALVEHSRASHPELAPDDPVHTDIDPVQYTEERNFSGTRSALAFVRKLSAEAAPQLFERRFLVQDPDIPGAWQWKDVEVERDLPRYTRAAEPPERPVDGAGLMPRAHAAAVAKAANLSEAQTAVIVAELRNALGPVLHAAEDLSRPRTTAQDARIHAIKRGTRRVLLLADALARRTYGHQDEDEGSQEDADAATEGEGGGRLLSDPA